MPITEERAAPACPVTDPAVAVRGVAPPPDPAQRAAARLKIAVVTETWPPEVNGVAGTAARFVAGLRETGHQVSLVRPRQPDDRDAPGHDDEHLVRGIQIPQYPQLRMGLPAGGQLRELWSRRRPDVVHLVTEGPLGLSALRAARALGLPLASDFRTNFHAYGRHYGLGWAERPARGYLRWFHNRTQATMVPTAAIRDRLAQQGFDNLHVVARGVDTARFDPARRSEALRRQWGARARAPVLLYVGRLAPEKNLALVCDAYDAVRRERPDARLVFVGDGPMAGELRERCPRAVFAGVRRGEDLAAHFASADLFVFASLTETYGNVVLEAMASGLPIVAFDDAAAGEHVLHGAAGLLARPDEPGRFVRHAARLAGDPARLAACGGFARRTAAGLSWDRVVRAQLAVFQSVLADRRPTFAPLPAVSGVSCP